MSLFDGKPLTEREVMLNMRCVCEHVRLSHRGDLECRICQCDEFRIAPLTTDVTPE